MMSRYSANLPLLAGVLALFGARPAAAVPGCAPEEIEVAPELSARWPDLVSHVREAFRARDDIDHCAGVRLISRDGSVAVEVTLPDGRFAMRTVSRPEDVVPTLESLLLVPPPADSSSQVPLEALGHEDTSPLEPSRWRLALPKTAPLHASAPRARTESGYLALRRSEREEDASEIGGSHRREHLRIELSAVAGGRIGDGQTGVGLGAFSFLDVSGWLFGFEGRVDRYRSISLAPTDGGALELALLGGRRFWIHDLAWDVTAGPAAAVQGTATFATRSTMTGEDVTQSSSSTVPRLLVGTRMSFSAHSVVHPFVGIDGELGPSRAKTDVPGASRLPIWTLGLALGATVGTK